MGRLGLGTVEPRFWRRPKLAILVITAAIAFSITLTLGAQSGLAAAVAPKTSAGEQYADKKVIKPIVKGVSTTHTSAEARQTPRPVASTASGALPFTGVSLLGAVVIGVGMVGLGAMLVRRQRYQE